MPQQQFIHLSVWHPPAKKSWRRPVTTRLLYYAENVTLARQLSTIITTAFPVVHLHEAEDCSARPVLFVV